MGLTGVSIVQLGGEVIEVLVEVKVRLRARSEFEGWRALLRSHLRTRSTHRVVRLVDPRELRADVRRRVLERRRRLEVVVLERVEVEHARDHVEHVLPQRLIERERLHARERVRGRHERLARDLQAWVGCCCRGGRGGECGGHGAEGCSEGRETAE